MSADKRMNHFPAVAFLFLPRFFLPKSGAEFIPVFLDSIPGALFTLGWRRITLAHSSPFDVLGFILLYRQLSVFAFMAVSSTTNKQPKLPKQYRIKMTGKCYQDIHCRPCRKTAPSCRSWFRVIPTSYSILHKSGLLHAFSHLLFFHFFHSLPVKSNFRWIKRSFD